MSLVRFRSKAYLLEKGRVAQSVEQRTENPRVTGSIPVRGILIISYQLYNMRKWLSGRASPCQGEGREFESRLPLQFKQILRSLLFYVCENIVAVNG